MPLTSFLDLNDVTLDRLPSSIGNNWLLWEQTAKDIPNLLASGNLRNFINDELPEIHFIDIASCPEIVIERVYTLLCFIAHAYIRGAPGDLMMKVLSCLYFSLFKHFAETSKKNSSSLG
jgi:hypothetical protein